MTNNGDGIEANSARRLRRRRGGGPAGRSGAGAGGGGLRPPRRRCRSSTRCRAAPRTGCRRAEKNRQWDPNAPLRTAARPRQAAARRTAGPGARPDRRDRRAPEPPARGRQRPAAGRPASKPPHEMKPTPRHRPRQVARRQPRPGLIRSPTSCRSVRMAAPTGRAAARAAGDGGLKARITERASRTAA